jgi:hypothetical protein
MDSKEVALKNFEGEESETEKKMVPVSMDEFKSLEKIPNSGEAAVKTRYDKPTNMTIDKVQLTRMDGIETSNDGDRFIQYRINIFYSNGEKEGLGGFRAYLNEEGKPERFWNSEKSAGGKIKKMLEGFLELDEPLRFTEFVEKLQGLKVRVRSDDWVVGKDKGFKNLPIEFLPKE